MYKWRYSSLFTLGYIFPTKRGRPAKAQKRPVEGASNFHHCLSSSHLGLLGQEWGFLQMRDPQVTMVVSILSHDLPTWMIMDDLGFSPSETSIPSGND